MQTLLVALLIKQFLNKLFFINEYNQNYKTNYFIRNNLLYNKYKQTAQRKSYRKI